MKKAYYVYFPSWDFTKEFSSKEEAEQVVKESGFVCHLVVNQKSIKE